MFSCLSDTCFCLTSTWSLRLSNPVLPLWARSEYSRPHSPLHFQSQCVGAHIWSLASANASKYDWGLLLIYRDFKLWVPIALHCIYRKVQSVLHILKANAQRMVESGMTSDCRAQGGSIRSWVVSSFLSSPWQHLHTSRALVAIRCSENIQTARRWQPYLYSHAYLTLRLAFRSPRYKFVMQTKVHGSAAHALRGIF